MINFKNTLLLGHRGARGEALENTLAGFKLAQNLQSAGLIGVEFDVQLSADGHLLSFMMIIYNAYALSNPASTS